MTIKKSIHYSLFTAAIAAYGAFLVPKIFGWAYSNYSMVTQAFYVLIVFTVITMV